MHSFAVDPNKNPDVVNVSVVSEGMRSENISSLLKSDTSVTGLTVKLFRREKKGK